MKTLIVALYPYNSRGLDSWIDHGAGMTYTSAKQQGCNVSFLDMKSLHSDRELAESLKGYDLIAISMKSSYYAIGMKVIKYAKANGSKVMVGGYHATAAPNELVENEDVDYIFQGESEITFPEFLKYPSRYGRQIKGEKPQNLDNLPYLDRSIYRTPIEDCSKWWYGGKLSKMTSVMAARGCPYRCAFCQPIEDNHFGKKLRRRSVDSIISELKQLKSLYNPECVMIHDDTFLLQPQWLEEFIEKYPQIGLPFWASARADGVCKHPDLVRRLINVGWELISIGFESGSQRILNKLKKDTTVEQNLEAAKIVHSYGGKLYANYITGIPWETKWDIQATHKMVDEIAAEMPSWAYFTPYPGCELGDDLIKRGWSLLDRESYDRCPSGTKVKYVDYNYISKAMKGFRETIYPEFCDIIIPSYKNESFTINCLNSVKAHTKPGTYRVIWIDYGSDNSVDKVLESMDHLTIKLPSNKGFVYAVNEGLKVSDAPNICFLNNDTVVSSNWLQKLISALSNDPKLGIVGPLTNYGVDSTMDSHHSLSLHSDLLPSEARNWDLEAINKRLELNYSNQTYPASFVAFLCAVLKREVVEKVGLLDDNFAMGMWDDVDYNRSARSLGYKTNLAIDTCIQHFGRTTFNMIQKQEKFDVNKLLKVNKSYLDKKWREKRVSAKVLLTPLDTSIISRAIYDTVGDKSGLGILTKYRLSIMQRYFINSLKNQTDQYFTLFLITGHKDSEPTKLIESLDWGNLNVNFIYSSNGLSDWRESVKKSNKIWSETDPGCPEQIAKTADYPKTPIMARLDTDDWVAPGWIAHMKHLAAKFDESHFLINYQIIGQYLDGRLYNYGNTHTKRRTSPFIALVQKTDPRITPYEDNHIKMGKLFRMVHTVPPSYAFMVLHDENRLNRFYDYDSFIGDEDTSNRPELVDFKKLPRTNIKINGSISRAKELIK